MTSRFDDAAEDWDKKDMRQKTAQKVFEAIDRHVALEPNMDIMDFGSGTGLLSFKIAPFVHSVTAVDLSAKMLEQLESKNSSSAHINTISRDIMRDPLKERFNGIVSSMAMHHVADTQEFFDVLYAHLKRGGFIAIADLHKEDGSFHTSGNEGVHHFGFDTQQLKSIMEKSGFKNIAFHHAHTIDKPHKNFDLFLLTAMKT